MQLRYSPTSPYVRAVLVTAHELGLEDRIERIATNPWDPSTDLGRTNPLSKVPTLITDDGEILFDSRVICAYLAAQAPGHDLDPAATRWAVQRRVALANGLLDAAILRRLELARPDGERSAGWASRQAAAVARSLDALEGECTELAGGGPRLDQIVAGCALAYLDFRFGAEPWRPDRPSLASWFAAWSERPSMTATEPPAA
ncbi:glutathione S-transferase N-terminal domain-containing protein [Marinivivus vitaminiproducens]|uniref:glutathione S-transferase N-terminal domain-containing protein n=1 Tax=Marinivivus vitaminiproducens TaxID=3035935 RepID=UPI0027A7C09A|nr:glutathione S-transferase N-terminal domain-containing protein [Geminicoccaceae bacterium SCSIO 64248]